MNASILHDVPVLLLANAALAVSLVALPKAAIPAHKTPAAERGMRVSLGIVCILFMAVNIALAFGLWNDTALFHWSAQISPASFVTSAFAYAVCSFALLSSARGRPRGLR